MNKSQRNYSLDVCRFFAALLVIVCHSDLLMEYNSNVYQFVARFMPRVGVAFFFAISGYYYIMALTSGKKVFKKQMISLLKVYGTWTLIYYSLSFITNVLVKKENLGTFLVERIQYFVGRGSYSHFWFFPALIYSVILTTLFYKWKGKKGLTIITILSLILFVVGNLGSSY